MRQEEGTMMEDRDGFTKAGRGWNGTGLKAGRGILYVFNFLLFTAFLCHLTGQTAFGDVIWTPDDTFYDQNYEDCEYMGRRYYANGPKGYIRVMDQPAGGKIIDSIANGPVLYVSMTYENGGTGKWGLVQYRMDEDGIPVEDYGWEDGATVGWIDMKDLLNVYDGISFMGEHESEIKETDRESMPQVTMPDSGLIYLWEYPGAEICYNKLDSLEGELMVDHVYEDPEGDLWGHTVYYYGIKEFWINLSNPGEEKHGTANRDKPQLYPAISREELENLPDTVTSGRGLAAAVVSLIVLTAGGTAVLVRWMAKRKDRDDLS